MSGLPPNWPPAGANTKWLEENPPPKAHHKLRIKTVWFRKLIDHYQDIGWPPMCVDWPWGPTASGGRRTAYYKGEAAPITHIALDVCGQPRPTKQHQALHSCDRGTEGCFNVLHLRWGLEIENRLDQVARSRGDIGKIGLDIAREVRRELEEISERRGVPLDAIARIAGGKTWTDDKWETS